ncbi:cytidylyltransferase domain-containing protein, partial [Planctomycetota bacterium]
ELDPEYIDGAVKLLAKHKTCGVSTICSPMEDQAELEDPHTVKCVVNVKGLAMYFSRASIPFPRLIDRLARPEASILLKHQGVYCFRRKELLEFANLESPPIEAFEGLEQLRLLWYGYPIRVFMSGPAPKGIDTPKDYELFVKRVGRGRRRGRRKR